MYSKLIASGSALLLGAALSVTALGQQPTPAQQENSAAEKNREWVADNTAKNYAKHEPHMAAAMQHLRQAEEELEKTSNNHGPARDQAMSLTKQAETKVAEGMQYYDQHVSPNTPPKK
jgi:predicted secreted Zn-dependent protease